MGVRVRARKRNARPYPPTVRRAAPLLALVLTASLASSCALQGKKAEADRIIASYQKAQLSGTAVGKFSQSLRVIKSDLASQFSAARGAISGNGADGKGKSAKGATSAPAPALDLAI